MAWPGAYNTPGQRYNLKYLVSPRQGRSTSELRQSDNFLKMGRKKKLTPATAAAVSPLTHLTTPLLYVGACILLFSLLCTPQFWSTAKLFKVGVTSTYNTAVNRTTHYFLQSTVLKASSSTTSTTAHTPPILNNKNPAKLSAENVKSTTTATTTTTTNLNSATPPIPVPNPTASTSSSTSSSTPKSKLRTIHNIREEADMGTALLKLKHMLHSIDTNISFTTNATLTNEEALKRELGGPFRDDILNELGIVHFQQGNRTKALSMWRQALAFNSASFRVHLNFAQTLYKGADNMTKDRLHEDRKEAVFTVTSLLQLRTKCEPHKQVGKRAEIKAPSFCAHLSEHKKDFEDALYDAYQFMGSIKSHEEKPYEAEAYYKQALKMKPWDQQLHILLAGVYENMALFGQAKSYYKQCSKLGSSKGGGMVKAMKKTKDNAKSTLKKTKDQVVAEAYDEMDRQNLGAVCAKRSRQLDKRLAEWIKKKGDGGT